MDLLAGSATSWALDLVVGVLDVGGQVVQGVRVEVAGKDCRTDVCGICRLENVPVGSHRVRVVTDSVQVEESWSGAGQGEHWHIRERGLESVPGGGLQYRDPHVFPCIQAPQANKSDEIVVWLLPTSGAPPVAGGKRVIGLDQVLGESGILQSLLTRLAARPEERFEIFRFGTTLAVWTAGRIEVWRHGDLQLLGHIDRAAVVERVLPLLVEAAVRRLNHGEEPGTDGLIKEAWAWPEDAATPHATAVRFSGEDGVDIFLAPPEEVSPLARSLSGFTRSSIPHDRQDAFLRLLAKVKWRHGRWLEAGGRRFILAQEVVEVWDLERGGTRRIGNLRGADVVSASLLASFLPWMADPVRGEKVDAEGLTAGGLEAIVAGSGPMWALHAAHSGSPSKLLTVSALKDLGDPLAGSPPWAALLPDLLRVAEEGHSHLEIGEIADSGRVIRAGDLIYGPAPVEGLRAWGNAAGIDPPLLNDLLAEAATRRSAWQSDRDPLLWEETAAFGTEGVAVRFAGSGTHTLVAHGERGRVAFPVLGSTYLKQGPAGLVRALVRTVEEDPGTGRSDTWEILRPADRPFVYRSGTGSLFGWEPGTGTSSGRLVLWGKDIARVPGAFETLLAEAEKRLEAGGRTTGEGFIEGAWAGAGRDSALLVARFSGAGPQDATLITSSDGRKLIVDVRGLNPFRANDGLLRDLASVLPPAPGGPPELFAPEGPDGTVFLLAARELAARRSGGGGFIRRGGPIKLVPEVFPDVLRELLTRDTGFADAQDIQASASGGRSEVKALLIRFTGDAAYEVFARSDAGALQRYRLHGVTPVRGDPDFLPQVVGRQTEWKAAELDLMVESGWVFLHDRGVRLWAARPAVGPGIATVGHVRNLPGPFESFLSHLAGAIGDGSAEGFVEWSHSLEPGADGFAALEVRYTARAGRTAPFLFPTRGGTAAEPLEITGLEEVRDERDLLASLADLLEQRKVHAAEIVVHAGGERRLFSLVPASTGPGGDLLAWRSGGFVVWGHGVEKVAPVFGRLLADAVERSGGSDGNGLLEECLSFPAEGGVAAMGVRYAGTAEHLLFADLDNQPTPPLTVVHLERIGRTETGFLRALITASGGGRTRVFPGQAFAASGGLYGWRAPDREARQWGPEPPELLEQFSEILTEAAGRVDNGAAVPVIREFPAPVETTGMRSVLVWFSGEPEPRAYLVRGPGAHEQVRVAPGFDRVRHLPGFLALYLGVLADGPQGARRNLFTYPSADGRFVFLWTSRSGGKGLLQVWGKDRPRSLLAFGEVPEADLKSLLEPAGANALESFVIHALPKARVAGSPMLWFFGAAGYVLDMPRGSQAAVLVHRVEQSSLPRWVTLQELEIPLQKYLAESRPNGRPRCGLPVACENRQSKQCIRDLLDLLFRYEGHPPKCRDPLNTDYKHWFENSGGQP